MITKYKKIIFLIVLTTLCFASCSKSNSGTVNVSFNDSKIKLKKNEDIYLLDQSVIIAGGGEYTLTGIGENIQIIIKSIEPVTLILQDLEIYNDDKSPILILSDCTTNIVSTGEETNKFVIKNGDKNACIESSGIVNISGSGEIYLEGYKGIDVDNEITINANLKIVSTGDGIKSSKINLANSNLDISSEKDGLQADTIVIESGNILINGLTKNSRGIYAKESIDIYNGNIIINSIDDGICSKDRITIYSGNVTINTKDDAIHADSLVEIKGGVIAINSSLEGIESGEIVINDGDISIISTNDGLNGAFSDKDNSENADIYINGGTINIDAGGDGIDANGSIYVNGGLLHISGATDSDNNAMDFDNEFVVNGGLIAAAGNKTKVKQPSERGKQISVMINFEDTQSTNNDFVFTDQHGNLMLSVRFPKPYDCIVISSDSLVLHQSYYFGTMCMEKSEDEYGINTDSAQLNIENLSQFIITSNSTWVFQQN